MKKLFLLFALALCAQTNAQTFSVTSDETGYQLLQNDVIHYWIPATNGSGQYWDERHFSVSVSNQMPDSFQVRRTILAHADPGAEVYFCTDWQCTGAGDNYCDPYLLGANARINLILDYKTNSAPGLTTVLYSIYNLNNLNDSFYFTVNYHITTGAVGIAEHSSSNALSAPVPNPASSNFALQYNTGNNTGAVLNMYNTIGELVSSTTLSTTQGIHVTDTAALPEGIYICTLVSEGIITGTQRIVVVH